MHTPNVREFNKFDWNCYSRAIPFQDGSPLIVDDLPVVIIADMDGIEIGCEHFTFQVNKTTHPQAFSPFWGQELARLCLLNLAKTWSNMTAEGIKNYCKDHGFSLIIGRR